MIDLSIDELKIAIEAIDKQFHDIIFADKKYINNLYQVRSKFQGELRKKGG